MHHLRPRSPQKSAFTLVELSIAIAIIGLLVGAVLGGQSLFNQSQLQTVVTDYSKYSTAVSQFRQQYGGFPGDMIDATSFWPGTGDGNGNGNMADGNEPYRAWQQLVLADYIRGSFTGVTGGGSSAHSIIGTNVPGSRVQNAGWSFWYKASTSADTNQYDQDLSNFLAFGAAITNGLTQAAALTPTDAWQVDTKVDNGLPGTGRVVSLKPASLANCATSATDASAEYNRTNTSVTCALNISLTLK